MSKSGYKKLLGQSGIYKHSNSKHYLAIKKVKGKVLQKTFVTIYEATQWRARLEKDDSENVEAKSRCSTLNEVWETMQRVHFPLLATSTKAIWQRRYTPWKKIEHLPMDQITPAKVTSWLNDIVEYFRSDFYQESGRGTASRCNLDNELNLFVTIFNWYKEGEEFEKEALHLTCPIKTKHKKQGFIKPVPDKRKKITLEHALEFFDYLKPLYRDLAKVQFFTAGRVGEVAGLQWSNIDLQNKRMLIKHACVWDMTSKTFIELKPFPKYKQVSVLYF